ncbi:MAG TPA: NADH:flavin oxidoreductase/NADH oxidase family protein [Polyangiaceae bacterium LLY-WYZ-15_(1-7)]|nr:NADH:flavin oxidoreductase [Myxococcales bacterium]MAT29738.1 NADH:flavin oxidoreductase [Sandaracinus sp.]HJK95163.1 NADH:flavin oxidoreductase/NADH oxidase family protein [Polyangiaceae bacterium LLY-WYZ-15_(1-7)]MBJ72210.1 NADH:flavin oxidoreductase [Sandaracinus sp.]HJL04738.1 NADH:flavin oxidoreductase/NADH oxidase family protein [Polyangiaceae bacterium LLY-WYZ-15_(1-7)]
MTTSLADPFTLPCGLALPNRIAKAAMTEDLADVRTNDPNARHERLYRRWARGGLGLQITGNVMVDRRYLERTGNIVVDAKTDRAALARWAEACTEGGAKALVQINHPGRQCSVFVSRQPVAPSPVKVDVLGSFATPRALEDGEIVALVERYAEVAGAVVEAGFDGVQIHAAHGYLASQFLSPHANRRRDRWGGDLAGRARFLLEIVRRTRERIGPDAALAVKLNSADFQRGGFEEADSLAVAAMLEAEGIDLLEISGGNYESPELLGVRDARRESTKRREAYFLDYAEKVRREVKTPLMLTGGLRTRATMEAVVGEGAVDLVGLARPLALEPELARKLLAGEVERSAATEKKVGVRQLDAMAEAGWYGMQLARVADGREPDPTLSPWRAIPGYLGGELWSALRRAF